MVLSSTFTTMQKDIQPESTESVKIKSKSVNKARDAKKVTGVPISTFIEKAIDKEFDRLPKSVKSKIVNT